MGVRRLQSEHRVWARVPALLHGPLRVVRSARVAFEPDAIRTNMREHPANGRREPSDRSGIARRRVIHPAAFAAGRFRRESVDPLDRRGLTATIGECAVAKQMARAEAQAS
jgi:hypothetical protein